MNTIILKTKLRRPLTGRDIIPRPRLLERLDHALFCPLTLITAPAGYGKSTLASQWLGGLPGKTGWVTCDAEDNDGVRLLIHIVTACNTAVPGLCLDSLNLLQAIIPPPLNTIIDTVVNDMAALDETFILVLDDHHLIQDGDVLNALQRLVKHLPQMVHVVLCGRYDPPWSLVEWRAGNQLMEIRLHELAFSDSEAQSFFNTAGDLRLSPDAAAALRKRMDGWPASLRLSYLALRRSPELLDQAGNIEANSSLPRDVAALLEIVLSGCTTEQQHQLMKLSILDRFCAPLVETLMDAQPDPSARLGEAFMDWLRQSELLVIPLDQSGDWYRFHQLLNEYLGQQLSRCFPQDEIAAMHSRVSEWFAANNDLNAAINHVLLAGDRDRAIQLLADHRHEFINQERWYFLNQWLGRFDRDVVQNSPHLLLIQALFHDSNFMSLPRVDLDRVECLIDEKVSDETEAAIMRAEVDVLRVPYLNRVMRDYARSKALVTRALEILPREWASFRLTAASRLGAAQFNLGDVAGAYATLQAAELEAYSSHLAHQIRVAHFACWAYVITSDTRMLVARAREIIARVEPEMAPGTVDAWACAHYSLGYDAYLQNKLDIAQQHFSNVLAQVDRITSYSASIALRGMALIHQIRGADDQVWEMVGWLARLYQSETEDNAHPELVLFTAELLLRFDRVAAALAASQMVPLTYLGVRSLLDRYSSQISVIKILLRQRNPQDIQRAAAILTPYQAALQRANCWHHLSETFAVEAILHDVLGDEKRAMDVLQKAVDLAKPRNYVRCLADAGPQLIPILRRFEPLPDDIVFVQRVLEALLVSPAALANGSQQSDQVLLTQRELEILRLLSLRWTNQEISTHLYISIATVKRHSSNIFQKLSVNSRREAVEAGIELGLLD